MHMSDALVSPPVFAAAGAVSLALIGVAIRRVAGPRSEGPDTQARMLPLMGVMGAFVFAAQMLNFSIPGTGSSGHLVGGILLAAVLGPWAAYLTLASVVVLQCLLFADGGFMALGCNLLNMAALSTLVAYPLVFRPIAGSGERPARLMWASLAASVAALELGALAVTVETEVSGITALPFGRFLAFMLPIHLFIGIGEGLATAAVLGVIRRYRPSMLGGLRQAEAPHRLRSRTLAILAVLTLALGTFGWIASDAPDGLEWSIEKTAGVAELAPAADPVHRTAAALQRKTALMPDYGTTLAGVVGCCAILAAAFGASWLLRSGRREP